MRPKDDWLTIVTVSFNSETVLPRMLASVPEGVKVVIVDNASTSIAAIRQIAANHDAELVELSENKGFGVACNIGAARARTEFLLFLNPDVEIRPHALEALRTAAARYPAASAFNPRILDESGATSLKRRSNLLPRAEWLPRGNVDADCEVPVLAGSAIFVRKADFDAVGGFDPLIFLYYEDDDLSLRLRRERGTLYFIASAEVMHTGGASSARSAEVARIKGYHLGRSRVYCSIKHNTPFGRTKAATKALLSAISPLVLFSKRKRAKDWARLEATFKTLVSPVGQNE
ncbi:MAG: glycosyltransferase family 2 protein [Rhodobacterales bacterium]